MKKLARWFRMEFGYDAGLRGLGVTSLLVIAFAAVRLLAGPAPIEEALKAVGWVALGAGAGYVLSYGFTDALEATMQHRAIAYTLCFLAVFFLSVVGVCIVASRDESGNGGVSLETRDVWIIQTFMVMIIPALIGVRFALRGARTLDEPPKSTGS